MKSNASKIELKLYDDLFETDESRAENALSKIRDIPIVEIDDFPDHPFKVRDEDDDMTQLIESIKERGIITPATVRQKEDERYELISGHRRKRACELAGMETLKAEVKELSRDDAIILMVDSNLQRSTILPSERAFSYKMRLDAMKRQAGRPSKENGVPVGHHLLTGKSRELLAEKSPDSNTQIQRYIRLTYLVPEILEMVDEKRIAFRPAVEISFLPTEQQNLLVDAMEYADATPSLAQSIKMRDYSSKGQLNEALIESIMEEEKPNQRIKSRFDERITQLIPKNVPKGKESDFVVKALEYYKKFLERNNRER